jgi:hypothetical protein
MQSSLISVIVPVYNAEQYLERCVSSVLTQTHQDLELVLVDDGSTDSSPELCARFAGRDTRVRVLTRSNGGLSAARNSGLDVATGEYVQFLDADDWAESDMLLSGLRELQEMEGDVLISGFFVDVEDGHGGLNSSESRRLPRLIVSENHHLPLGALDFEFFNALGYAWNKLYRTAHLRRHGVRFEEGTSLVEDVLFNAAAFTVSARVVISDQSFVHYVQRPGATLGRRYHADYPEVVARAIQALRQILETWGLEVSEVERVLAPVRASRVVAGTRVIASQPGRSRAQRADDIRALCDLLDVRRLCRAPGYPGIPVPQKLLISLLARDRVTAAMLLVRLNELRRPA